MNRFPPTPSTRHIVLRSASAVLEAVGLLARAADEPAPGRRALVLRTLALAQGVRGRLVRHAARLGDADGAFAQAEREAEALIAALDRMLT